MHGAIAESNAGAIAERVGVGEIKCSSYFMLVPKQ